MDDAQFTQLLAEHKSAAERLAYYRLPSAQDAQDVLSQAYLTAYLRRETLQDPQAFKGWLFTIIRNKCNDFYRSPSRLAETPLAEVLLPTRHDHRLQSTQDAVAETLDSLPIHEKQLLQAFYFEGFSHKDIADRLGIPVGTVKSRLYKARANFKAHYPNGPINRKGTITMHSMPLTMPDYTINWLPQEPFPVVWEELMGWFIIPKLGEHLHWAMYDFPEKKRSDCFEMEVVGKASVHGVQGVEICAKEAVERRFIAQLTDSHCRILAESHMDGDIRRFYTFLDGDDFLPNWGFGPDNCGNETHLHPKGLIQRTGSSITCNEKLETLDVVGRCHVDINGKHYDTICVMDLELYEQGVATEQFIDATGRTVLWRRYNRNDWKIARYGSPWSERLPNNEQLIINDRVYIHWYDCITDYIL